MTTNYRIFKFDLTPKSEDFFKTGLDSQEFATSMKLFFTAQQDLLKLQAFGKLSLIKTL
jgi:hypothetical protein